MEGLDTAEIVIKWYTPILLLVGAVLSFADPITDILMLVEFYRTDHKTWFCVGLTFVLLPCLAFPLLYLGAWREKLSQYSGKRKSWETLLCGFHPFSVAFSRLQGFVYCLTKWWREEDEVDEEEPARYALEYSDMAAVFESVLEAAPQLIIQVYAISAQNQEVEDIQLISLFVSLFSLAWAFTIVDKILYERVVNDDNQPLSLKGRVFFFIGQFFSLGTRIGAILYFTMFYKWWIVVFMLSHTVVMLTVDIILCCANNSDCKCELGISVKAVMFCCLFWLRDDVLLQQVVREDFDQTSLRKLQKFCSVLFVLENTGMMLPWLLDEKSGENTVQLVLSVISLLLYVMFHVWVRFKLWSCVYDN